MSDGRGVWIVLFHIMQFKMDLTTATFEDFVKKNKTCVVDFWAPWCGPCRILAPALESACGEKGVPLGKVNIDESQELAVDFGVMSIPCVIKFKDGKEAGRFVGSVPPARIMQFLG